MNLMFRKNFSTEKTASTGGGGGKAKGALGAGRNAKRRDRDRFSCMEEHHYRTHLFFSAPRPSTQYNDGSERCGPVIGGGTGPELEPPQPLVTREPSVSLMRWDRPTSTEKRRTEPLPVPPPTPEKGLATKNQGSLSVLEVADPKLCILAHLMSPLEPIEPILESPLAKPIIKQKTAAGELLNDVAQANTAVGGMLLANMEKNAEFPFISYYVINTTQTDPLLFYNNMRSASLTKFDPKTIRFLKVTTENASKGTGSTGPERGCCTVTFLTLLA
ncbi:unnamed protein product [Leptidea sinapis]|uniref:DUF7153 domain-containing protein n=1 Tax=Leptidea sinapis TaxID=189913 RepID=A0A5E4QTT0_9NEOP|nr:unnamed protein product [Leptidea sinapis]